MKQLLLLLVAALAAGPDASASAGPIGYWVVTAYSPPSGGSDLDADISWGGSYWADVSVTALPGEVSVRVTGKTSPVWALSAQAAVSSHEFIAFAWVGDSSGGDVATYVRAELAGGHASVDGRRASLTMEAQARIETPITPSLLAHTRVEMSSNGSTVVQWVTVPTPGGGMVPLPVISDADGPNPAPLTIPPVVREAFGGDRRTTMYVERNTSASGSCAIDGTWLPFSYAAVSGEIPDGGTLGYVMFAYCLPPVPPEPPEED